MSTATEPNWDLLPASMRAKAEEVFRTGGIPAETTATTEEQPAGTPPPAEPAAAAEVPTEPKKEEAPAAPSAPQTTAPASTSEVATEEMTKEQRYKIMDGMLKASGRDLRQARAEVSALRDELEALKARISSPAPAAHTQPAAVTETATAASERATKLMEAFGSENLSDLRADMVEFMRSQGFVVNQDLQGIRDQVGGVTKTMAQSATDRFHQEMAELTGNKWLQINEDPKFIEFMNEEDGYSGLSRRDNAIRHLNQMDAPKLARYFADYMESSGQSAPAPQSPKLDKRKFASPKSTPAAGPSLDDVGKTVGMSEYKKFADDVRNGKYESRDPEQYKKLQAQMLETKARLDDAQRMGLIDPTR